MQIAYKSLFFILSLFTLFFSQCNNGLPKNEINGKALAAQYCTNCHQLPLPSDLNKVLWKNHVLPKMGNFMGFYSSKIEREQLIERDKNGKYLISENIFPNHEIISIENWQAIQNYYINNAPESLKITPQNISVNDQLFKAIIPPNKFNIPSTTMVKFNSQGGLFIGDANTKQFLELNHNFSINTAAELDEAPVYLTFTNNYNYVTSMGSFSPTDAASGSIVQLPKKGSTGAKIVIDHLKRPVNTQYYDMNGDGLGDFVVCEFGKFEGSLSLYLAQKNGVFIKKILSPNPGATAIEIKDMNKDGLPDIVALFAQAKERISIFYNLGNDYFKEEIVVNFRPSFGSTSISLVDLDNDGDDDIVYTAGDNADFEMILRPYHGIYFLINDGNNKFVKEFFYPLNGVYKVVVHDFDNDGDLDMATICFFPDWLIKPFQNFVYYQNKGNFIFETSTHSIASKGRWICMDAADYDSDGDIDLVLGSLIMEVKPKIGIEQLWIEEKIPFIVLENQIK